jgi:hypothetical protein
METTSMKSRLMFIQTTIEIRNDIKIPMYANVFGIVLI